MNITPPMSSKRNRNLDLNKWMKHIKFYLYIHVFFSLSVTTFFGIYSCFFLSFHSLFLFRIIDSDLLFFFFDKSNSIKTGIWTTKSWCALEKFSLSVCLCVCVRSEKTIFKHVEALFYIISLENQRWISISVYVCVF